MLSLMIDNTEGLLLFCLSGSTTQQEFIRVVNHDGQYSKTLALLFVMAVSILLSMIKALVVKAFVSPEVQVGQAATRTAQMMRKGGL